MVQTIKNPPAGSGSGRSPGEGMATHSNILAWRSPWTEEPCELYSPWGHRELDMTERLSMCVRARTHTRTTQHSARAGHCSSPSHTIHQVIPTALCCGYYYSLHFADEETEAQNE